MKTKIYLLAAATLTTSAPAAVIMNDVITDLVGATGGYDIDRDLGVTISGDTGVYLVGTMTFTTDISFLDSSYNEANMGLGTVFNTGFGHGFGGDTIVITQNGTKATATETFAQSVPTRFVMKFDQTTGDTILWVNPNLGTTEGLNTASASVNVGAVNGADFDSVIFRGGDFNTTDPIVDFTDFAVYYGGSSPFFVPEPSALALLGLGGFSLLLRRRK